MKRRSLSTFFTTPIVRYRDYCRALFRLTKGTRIHVGRIGYSQGKPQFPIYSLTIPSSSRHTICIAAGVHGDEKSGPMAVLEALFHQSFMHKGPRLIIFPVVNPYGFDRTQRRGAYRFDLNRRFTDAKPPKEIRQILATLKRETIDAFLSLHEDDELKKPYLHAYIHEKDSAHAFRTFTDALDRAEPLIRQRVIHGRRAVRGCIVNPPHDGSFEDQMHRDGVPISVCYEVPDQMPFPSMINANRIAMHALVAPLSSLPRVSDVRAR